MSAFENTRLWQTTLATRLDQDEALVPRESLRIAFLNFRERATLLAGEIARDLPDFTVHDVSHLDALWEMASIIAGSTISLTPTEAFVLGGAFLIHDLGMGLAAYVGGLDELRLHPRWGDTVAVLSKTNAGTSPLSEDDVRRRATAEVLRVLHAEQAERLASISWVKPGTDERYHLIEVPELRFEFGPLIGRIAHSHWWAVDELIGQFSTIEGAPTWCPNDWTIDPLKLACLLRAADVSHLDARRAPGFLHALRKPTGTAQEHWDFQERVSKPRIEAHTDRLAYTSRAFPLNKAAAWWLGYDLLRMVDSELRGVDAVLGDTSRGRFAARGVVGVEDPQRLSALVRTDGWVPVNTQIQVTHVAKVISTLGGEQLYGPDPVVPLRELIQNASDAVRARRMYEHLPNGWGEISVRFGSDEYGHWLEVGDNGIGMSNAALTGPLLDFGQSYWDSALMHEEYPGLSARSFAATGTYGIGFFAVFMWGERVRVTSRPYREGYKATHVLELVGTASRPLLRTASPDEYSRDGGTIVRVWFKEPFNTLDSFRERVRSWWGSSLSGWTGDIGELCAWLCPSLDANLYVGTGSDTLERVVAANDWITIEGHKLLQRITLDDNAWCLD